METPIEAGSLDRGVMPAVYIYAPPATRRFVLAKTCPPCATPPGELARIVNHGYKRRRQGMIMAKPQPLSIVSGSGRRPLE